MKHKVTFQPLGKRGIIKRGKTLLEASRDFGIEIEALCGGKQRCGKCRVIVKKGKENLSPLSEGEKAILTETDIASGHRLSCAAKVLGEVTAFLPEESRGGGQVILKEGSKISVKVDPVVKKYYVELEKAKLEDPRGDLKRLLDALEKEYSLAGLSADYLIIKELPDVLRKGKWSATVGVRGKEIISVEPGFSEKLHGIAFDIGTTTVVGYLTDLRSGEIISYDSMMNPQVAYGEDVMSRISYAMKNPKGVEEMQRCIVSGLNKIIENTTAKAGIKPQDISEVTVVGNTVMHHIFLNLNPKYLGISPFAPVIQESTDIKARDIGLLAGKGAYVHVLPNIGGFVGADNVGVLIATEPYKKEEIILTIDIGTNGEIVLGNRKKMMAASCATGPALEGAHIKFGMRAAAGAIEDVEIKGEKIILKVIKNNETKPRGICGSGVIKAVAEMLSAGILLENGNFNSNSSRVRKGKNGLEFVLAWKEETSIGKDITLTQEDIRGVQLAKAAIYAGAKVLMKRFGVSKVDRIVLAGAFGSKLDKNAALKLGMLPKCSPRNIIVVGNAAGDGARIALINSSKRIEAEKVAKRVEYVELTVDRDFEKEFIAAMHFPKVSR